MFGGFEVEGDGGRPFERAERQRVSFTVELRHGAAEPSRVGEVALFGRLVQVEVARVCERSGGGPGPVVVLAGVGVDRDRARARLRGAGQQRERREAEDREGP